MQFLVATLARDVGTDVLILDDTAELAAAQELGATMLFRLGAAMSHVRGDDHHDSDSEDGGDAGRDDEEVDDAHCSATTRRAEETALLCFGRNGDSALVFPVAMSRAGMGCWRLRRAGGPCFNPVGRRSLLQPPSPWPDVTHEAVAACVAAVANEGGGINGDLSSERASRSRDAKTNRTMLSVTVWRHSAASTAAFWAKQPALDALRQHADRTLHSRAYQSVFGGGDGCSDETMTVSTADTMANALEKTTPPSSVTEESRAETAAPAAIVGACDRTQARAVARALRARGSSFVIRGPPGTGKSATIANVACALAGAGRRVLVVCAEEAAVRVVVHKLRAACPALQPLEPAHLSKSSGGSGSGFGADARVAAWRTAAALARLPPDSFAQPFVLGETVNASCDAEPGTKFVHDPANGPWTLAADQQAALGVSSSSSNTKLEEPDDTDGGDILTATLARLAAAGAVGVALHRGVNARTGGPREWRFICEACGKTHATAPPLVKHLLSHEKKWSTAAKKKASAKDKKAARAASGSSIIVADDEPISSEDARRDALSSWSEQNRSSMGTGGVASGDVAASQAARQSAHAAIERSLAAQANLAALDDAQRKQFETIATARAALDASLPCGAGGTARCVATQLLRRARELAGKFEASSACSTTADCTVEHEEEEPEHEDTARELREFWDDVCVPFAACAACREYAWPRCVRGMATELAGGRRRGFASGDLALRRCASALETLGTTDQYGSCQVACAQRVVVALSHVKRAARRPSAQLLKLAVELAALVLTDEGRVKRATITAATLASQSVRSAAVARTRASRALVGARSDAQFFEALATTGLVAADAWMRIGQCKGASAKAPLSERCATSAAAATATDSSSQDVTEASASTARLIAAAHPIVCLTPALAAKHLFWGHSITAAHDTTDAIGDQQNSLSEHSPVEAAATVLGRFDSVIIDEASQFPTPMALPLAAASQQLVIVGDNMQLPPRRAALGASANGATTESGRGLLDDAIDVARLPLLPLEWHYRSGEPSLISVSNELFYGGRLVALPAAPPSLHPSRINASRDGDEGRGPRQSGLTAVIVRKGIMESDAGPPAGLVNRVQAEALVRDVLAHVAACDASRPRARLSVGVVTLNRPQRALIRSLLTRNADRFGLAPHDKEPGAFMRKVTKSAGRSREDDGDVAEDDDESDEDNGVLAPRDDSLFVESIDRIQGEERDVIFFSTLVAPRTELAGDVGGKSINSVADNDDALDALEQRGPAGDDSTDDSDDDSTDDERVTGSASRSTAARTPRAGARGRRSKRNATPVVNAARAAVTHGGCYSTLSHAHGHRLLNVGLTRAVRAMRVYVHPHCTAPAPHDARPGKRAFGWLVRTLLGLPSPCTCADCTARAARLGRTLIDRFESDGRHAHAPSTGVSLPVTSVEMRPLQDDDDDDHDDDSFAVALSKSLGIGDVCVVGTAGGADEAVATRDASGGAVAVLCGALSDDPRCWLDELTTLPSALQDDKKGWRRVERLTPADVLGWLEEPQLPGIELGSTSHGAEPANAAGTADALRAALRRVASGAATFHARILDGETMHDGGDEEEQASDVGVQHELCDQAHFSKTTAEEVPSASTTPRMVPAPGVESMAHLTNEPAKSPKHAQPDIVKAEKKAFAPLPPSPPAHHVEESGVMTPLLSAPPARVKRGSSNGASADKGSVAKAAAGSEDVENRPPNRHHAAVERRRSHRGVPARRSSVKADEEELSDVCTSDDSAGSLESFIAGDDEDGDDTSDDEGAQDDTNDKNTEGDADGDGEGGTEEEEDLEWCRQTHAAIERSLERTPARHTSSEARYVQSYREEELEDDAGAHDSDSPEPPSIKTRRRVVVESDDEGEES